MFLPTPPQPKFRGCSCILLTKIIKYIYPLKWRQKGFISLPKEFAPGLLHINHVNHVFQQQYLIIKHQCKQNLWCTRQLEKIYIYISLCDFKYNTKTWLQNRMFFYLIPEQKNSALLLQKRNSSGLFYIRTTVLIFGDEDCRATVKIVERKTLLRARVWLKWIILRTRFLLAYLSSKAKLILKGDLWISLRFCIF